MSYTPVELRHIRFRRGLFGYRRSSVDAAIADVAESFEAVWRERADLEDQVEQLQNDLVRYRELESLLRGTLVSAEKAAHDLRDQARREAELVLSEANAEAREITRRAAADRERLRSETRRVRALLASALDSVEDADDGSGDEGDAEKQAA